MNRVASTGGRPGGEILKSNVDAVADAPEAPKRGSRTGLVVPLLLGAVLIFVLGAGAGLWLTSSQSRAQPAARPTLAAVPTPLGSVASNGPLAPINGISCDALESTIVHIHAHLAVFVNGEEEQVPLGIGIGQPWQVSDSDEGPFVEDGTCFYWIHTHTEDGIVHIESPQRRRFTLGDFFAIWQMPLNENQVGPAQGPVITYVNGQRTNTAPQDVTLLPHERIQLDVGSDVPPYPFDFPDGD
jgi:hypothetical protein